MDSIYLNKQKSEAHTNLWVYYRLRGSTEDRGTIQVCKVIFPHFSDIGVPIDTPGTVGLNSIPEHLELLMDAQWGIIHSESCLIGFIV
jgi:hypothetical protein